MLCRADTLSAWLATRYPGRMKTGSPNWTSLIVLSMLFIALVILFVGQTDAAKAFFAG